MSDFSSWGPSPDLEIKPELTAHGGNILSAVPGQDYDEISGTSMATPNVSGLTALIRQYVKSNFPDIASDNVKVAAMVNRLLMSTADVVYNTNGLPYSVRKQGSGLANVVDAAATKAVILTYSRKDGSLMDKSKVELGDDPTKSGVYELSFEVQNFGTTALSYDISTIVMTEGVSETKTNQGDTTVTEDGYILEGANVVINSVANGSVNGQNISIGAGQTASVTLTITLTDENKKYLDESFKNGMYVEGFVTLKGLEGATDIGFPYLAFYGDWTVAPMFDLDYFATNKDELDESIDLLDKTLPDAYASRPIGGVYADYVSYLGTYYFEQKPGSNMISADRKYISLSNTEGTINTLTYAWMGMLRNAREVDVVITDDATGEVVFAKTEKDIRKSYGDGGPIYPAQVKIGFTPSDYNLPNNSTYTVTLTGRLDYGDGGVNTNLNNVFTFPLTIDFQAPIVEDVEFYTEYDKAEKKNRLFAKIAVYDNHYAMSALIGTISANASTGLALNGFDHYMTPIYSTFNGTSYITYELTDHIDTIKKGYKSIYEVYGATQAKEIVTSPIFTVSLYDYALNNATYEISLPNNFVDGYFNEEKIVLSPNETYTLEPVVYPADEMWIEMLTFESTNPAVVNVLPDTNQIVATGSGLSLIIASYKDPVTGTIKEFEVEVEVLKEGDEGFRKFDEPVVHKFEIPGYHTNKAYYLLDSTERKIGQTGDDRTFPNKNNLSLDLYPSESVTLRYDMIAYYPSKTTIEYKSSNSNIVEVDATGTITAKAEGFASISVNVLKNGEKTYYSKNISVTVKDPYVTSGPTLTHYYGLGGTVIIPTDLAITEIGTFAFSNYDYVEKTEGDLINDENPELTKQWFLGDNTITEVVIPEGVETISAYAFANLTALTRVTLPSTLTTISYGAFYGCSSLTEVKGLGNVKFINQDAFAFCKLDGTITFNRTIAIADYAFANNAELDRVVLSASTKSVGQYAFSGNTSLSSLTINADKIKLGQFAFNGCSKLETVAVNDAVIP
ncbi:MAG: leucine-rich repeat protein, partial [Clostridia bacterium]|nr:leucine-rich repeat protein [Clostridia bacterium]